VSPHYTARLRIALVLVVAILIQTTLASDLRVLQVAPDLMLLIAICAGMAGGAQAGAWVGFWSGLLADMFLTTPVGLSALTYCLVGAAVGAVREGFLQEHRLLLPVVAFVATAAAVVLFVGIGDLLGQNQLLAGGRSWLIRVAVIEAAWNAVLAIPVSMIYGRAARGSVGVDRVTGAGAARATAKADRLAIK
jgi:rod shape-determining protein MreD